MGKDQPSKLATACINSGGGVICQRTPKPVDTSRNMAWAPEDSPLMARIKWLHARPLARTSRWQSRDLEPTWLQRYGPNDSPLTCPRP